MEKLVRDKIAEFVFKERGEVLTTRLASEEEMLSLLKNKLVEEANEVLNATSNDNLIEELADVLEVLKALIVKQNIAEEVFKKREDKCLERGGFDNGVILIK
jgi:predicted house-cleaning noncanonical NTP pyrophosphatase (MazG superfamily)